MVVLDLQETALQFGRIPGTLNHNRFGRENSTEGSTLVVLGGARSVVIRRGIIATARIVVLVGIFHFDHIDGEMQIRICD